ncbi:hypothetical protein M0R45_003965 [Rubus argutus]|uniref:Uncharacterized protein n=1 Tax=Rubus argutus TaxID=59490 RepID=A0AAW1YI19_RUBAR
MLKGSKIPCMLKGNLWTMVVPCNLEEMIHFSFHALGKFLHNKRETENMELDGAAFHVREGLSRLPLKMDAPEKILCQAHGQARPIADFLHENVLDFLSEGGNR